MARAAERFACARAGDTFAIVLSVRLHQVRDDAYGAERKRETKRSKRCLVALEGLQDYLGSLNDLATAPDMLSQLELSEVTGAEDLFSAADKKELLQGCRGSARISR